MQTVMERTEKKKETEGKKRWTKKQTKRITD